MPPVITAGEAFTVATVLTVQPLGKVYTIVVVPAPSALKAPVVEPIVATAVVLLVHVPPVVALVKVVVTPSHTCIGEPPLMAAGRLFTDTIRVVVQPVPNEYVAIHVPEATPVTMPDEEPIVAIVGHDIDHVPPADGFVNVVVCPTHTVGAAGATAPGKAYTVTVVVAEHPPAV